MLAQRLIRLGVSNIRVINRLGALDDELATIVSELHPNVLADMVNTLALFLKLRTSFLGKAFPRLTICSDTAVMSGPSISTTKKKTNLEGVNHFGRRIDSRFLLPSGGCCLM